MTASITELDKTEGNGQGPKYVVNIEGTNFDWDAPSITPAQVRQLGGLPTGTPVELIDLNSNEQRTLGEDESVELRPGLGFAKRVRFQRG